MQLLIKPLIFYLIGLTFTKKEVTKKNYYLANNYYM